MLAKSPPLRLHVGTQAHHCQAVAMAGGILWCRRLMSDEAS